jgi:hypothetical protein
MSCNVGLFGKFTFYNRPVGSKLAETVFGEYG